MATDRVTARIATGFDDAALTPGVWEEMLRHGGTNTVFLTLPWQRAWWDSFGRGQLLLVIAERDGRAVAVAPLFSECGMVYFVGSGSSDYLDFVGDVSDPAVLDVLLIVAQDAVAGFIGFVFYHVLDHSPSSSLLRGAAERCGLTFFDEGELPAPAMDLTDNPERALAATRKDSLVRHENYFRRNGTLEVRHYRSGHDVLLHLEEFFAQHVARWAPTAYPSLFLDPKQRAFYNRLARDSGASAWLRFTRVDWDGRAIAFHFGFCYRGSYLWYKPTFANDLAKRSPGEVLLRQLLLAAIDEKAHSFDFGLGNEAFKSRFATHAVTVRNWGLYAPEYVGAAAFGTGDCKLITDGEVIA